MSAAMPSLPKFLFPSPMATDFTLQNLPYGVFKKGANIAPRAGVAIGNKILDLSELAEKGKLHPSLKNQTLNAFMAEGKEVWHETRSQIKQFLSDDHADSLKHNANLLDSCILNQQDVQMVLPAAIGDYTDFYASKEHATNLGCMFRDPAKALLPNWLHIPVGYHGRASSVVVSGVDLHRPRGQQVAKDQPEGPPKFDRSNLVDIELEVAVFIGPGNELGKPIAIGDAEDHIFGMVLMNDWSARDIQKWEYVPLGPFLGKNFGTTISPWIVPMETPPDASGERPLEYLQHPAGAKRAFDVNLQFGLQSQKMDAPKTLSNTNLKWMWWSFSQMIAHHTSNGCNLRPGDLLASGTISGPDKTSYGSMLEMTWAGKHSIDLGNGEERKLLCDYDKVVITGHCERDGVRIGFGECSSTLLPVKN